MNGCAFMSTFFLINENQSEPSILYNQYELSISSIQYEIWIKEYTQLRFNNTLNSLHKFDLKI